MNNTINKKIERSNKIYTIFYGLSADLIFFIAVNTLFLTEVKGLTAAEINLSTTISILISLIFYLFFHKIIKKIGNINSIKLGSFAFLISSILYTISNNIYLIIAGDILYELGFVLKCVDSVVLNNNLVYQKRENEYIKYRTRASLIYSLSTLIVTAIGGFLFNINPYLPMILGILMCLNNFILAHFLYEVKTEKKKEEKKKVKFSFTKIVILAIIAFGLLYGTVVICQTNDKLFIQSRLKEFLSVNNVALTLSLILFLSRISRLVSNLIFDKVYNKFKYKVLYILYGILLSSVLSFIIGKLVPSALIGSIIMTIGFLLLLLLRDPIENILSEILLKNVSKENKEQAMLYFKFSKNLTKFILSFIATIILTKHSLLSLYIIIAVAVFMYTFIIYKLLKLVKENQKA